MGNGRCTRRKAGLTRWGVGAHSGAQSAHSGPWRASGGTQGRYGGVRSAVLGGTRGAHAGAVGTHGAGCTQWGAGCARQGAREAGRGGHRATSCKVSSSCAEQPPDPAAPSPPARLARRKKAETERARARGGAARGRCGRDGAGRGGRQPELCGGGRQPQTPSPRRTLTARYLPAEQLSSASSAGGRIPAVEAARPSRSRAARTPCAPDPSRAPLLLPGTAPARAAPSGGRERERPSVRSPQL